MKTVGLNSCENCLAIHSGEYGSGRFCSSICARSYSSKVRREEVNRRVSEKLKGRKTGRTISEDHKKILAQARALQASLTPRKPKPLPVERKRRDFENLKSRNALKLRVLEDQRGLCNGCGLGSWRDRPLVLELEHKDGNSKNNDRSNLECLCPNCHSQTPTWRGRNKGLGNKISDAEYALVIQECGTIHGALTALGMAPKGNNYKRAKRVAEEFNLDISYPSGHRSPKASFTAEQVAEIRRLRSDNWKIKDIAAHFSVPYSTVSGVIQGRTYVNVVGLEPTGTDLRQLRD